MQTSRQQDDNKQKLKEAIKAQPNFCSVVKEKKI